MDEFVQNQEVGQPVEGEFVESWDWMEQFYGDLNRSFAPQVNNFIAAIREKGYARTLRAGQSHTSLILSRSRRHGLGPGQPLIQLMFHDNGMHVFTSLDGADTGDRIAFSEIALTPEIEGLLRQLQTKAID